MQRLWEQDGVHDGTFLEVFLVCALLARTYPTVLVMYAHQTPSHLLQAAQQLQPVFATPGPTAQMVARVCSA